MILDLNFTSASSEGSDEPVHLKSMTRAFAIHVHTVLPLVGVLGVFTSRNPGLPLGGRTPYITSKNRLRTPKLHIKDVPRTSENSLVRPKMDIETSCQQKKPAHIY